MLLNELQNKLLQPLCWDEWNALSDFRCDKSDKKIVIEKKGFGKNLRDEVLPLADFIRLHYPHDTPYCFKYVDGNQQYDMMVVDSQNKEIERIEVTKIIDGHSQHKSVKELFDKGIAMLSPNQKSASGMQKEAMSKKQSKDYVNCKLVIYIVQGELIDYDLNEMIEIIKSSDSNKFTGIFLVERSSTKGNPTKIVYSRTAARSLPEPQAKRRFVAARYSLRSWRVTVLPNHALRGLVGIARRPFQIRGRLMSVVHKCGRWTIAQSHPQARLSAQVCAQ